MAANEESGKELGCLTMSRDKRKFGNKDSL